MKRTKIAPISSFTKEIKAKPAKDNRERIFRTNVMKTVRKERSRNLNLINNCEKSTKEFIEHYPLPSYLNGYNPDVKVPHYAVETEPFEPHLVDTENPELISDFGFGDFGEIHVPAFDRFDENVNFNFGQNFVDLSQLRNQEKNIHKMQNFPPFPNFTYPVKQPIPTDIDSRQKMPFPKP